MTTANPDNELLPHLFRREYSKMTAVLCRHFGLKHIEIAQDIVSETFLKAMEHWPFHGIPANPTGWLYTVAKNKTKDYLKHKNGFDAQIKQDLIHENEDNVQIDFSDPEIISDSQLSMIVAICNTSVPVESQICLALQILGGFSIEEIAHAFVTKPETIKKRLHRAKSHLRQIDFQIKTLTGPEVIAKLDTVLKTLYLLFNEGYFSKSNNQLIRKELCAEALRLTYFLTEHHITNTPAVNALLALMCFQSSRLDARVHPNGDIILFEYQDTSRWDQSLIDKGNYFLVQAATGNQITKYHLEAGIAYWHTTLGNENKWHFILQVYNQLILLDHAPMTALNRIFAYSKVHGSVAAIQELQALPVLESSSYYALLGHLYTSTNEALAIENYKKAITLTGSKSEKSTLSNVLKQLTDPA